MTDELTPAHVERLLLLVRHAGSLVFWATKTAAEGYDFVNYDDRGDTTNLEELTSAVADVQAVVTLIAGCKDLDPDDVARDLVGEASNMLTFAQKGYPGALRHQEIYKLSANLVGVTYSYERLKVTPRGELP